MSAEVGTESLLTAGAGVSYHTDFQRDESPLSAGGMWRHAGLDWTQVATLGGVAFGTQDGKGGYDDSYAYLSGFPPNQAVSAIVHRDPGLVPDTTHEVELLLRWADANHNARGYECNFAYDGSYAGIVRWNGPRNSFKFLDPPSGTGHVPGGLHEGDVISARAVGNVISSYVNGTLIMKVVDDGFPDGNPGIGFFRGGPSPQLSDFGLSSFSASALSDTAPAIAPGAHLPSAPFNWHLLLAVVLAGLGALLLRRFSLAVATDGSGSPVQPGA